MANDDKMFVCSSSGCNMSFPNEDQLTVHKKKHDMMLNLGNSSKNGGFVADQTPTPTRFIRNCEEVGLFQDLQNVNPFEETFRRAMEFGKTGTLTVPEVGVTDDTLHTPHIFPHITDVLSTGNQMLTENSVQECNSISITEKSTVEKSIESGSDSCSNVKLLESDEQDLIKDKLTTDKGATLTENIIDQITRAPILSKLLLENNQQLSINGEEVQLLLKMSDGKVMQLSATSVCDSIPSATVQSTKQETLNIKTESPLEYIKNTDAKTSTLSTLTLAKMKLKQTLTKTIESQHLKSNNSSNSSVKNELCSSKKENRGKTVDDQVKKKEILERNRASSMRARAKRKAWIQQLERTVANVNETNVALQMEVKVLRTEVAKLKTLLLAHKDCSVTKAMQKGNGIVLGPKVISLNSDTITNSVSMGTLVKRTASEVPIVPKKRPSTMASKNPVIFPKIDCNTNLSIPNATLIKTVPTLKIMEVTTPLLEKNEPKQILIVQNSPRKLDNSRQIIQINPNYEVEQSVSKSNTT